MKGCLTILVILVSCLISNIEAQTFHLILAGDDSDKKNITDIISDLHAVEEAFTYLTSVNKMPLSIHRLPKDRYSPLSRSIIEKEIDKMSVAHDDIIVFYYTGHGCRTRNTKTIWPNALLHNEIIPFSQITEKLFEKKAALYVVILDCCNTLYGKGQNRENRRVFTLQQYDKHRIIAGFQKLFTKSKGLIIASAASPYGYAYHGVFSGILLNNLFDVLQSKSPRWDTVLQKTKDEAHKETKKGHLTNNPSAPKPPQTPQYKIFLWHYRRSADTYRKYLNKYKADKKGKSSPAPHEQEIEEENIQDDDLFLNEPEPEEIENGQ